MNVNYSELTTQMIAVAYRTMPLKMIGEIGAMLNHWGNDLYTIIGAETDEDIERFVSHEYNRLVSSRFGELGRDKTGTQQCVSIYVSDNNYDYINNDAVGGLSPGGIYCSYPYLTPVDDEEGGLSLYHKILHIIPMSKPSLNNIQSFIDSDCLRIIEKTIGEDGLNQMSHSLGSDNWINLMLLAKNASWLTTSAVEFYVDGILRKHTSHNKDKKDASTAQMLSTMMVGNQFAQIICGTPVGMFELNDVVYDIHIGVQTMGSTIKSNKSKLTESEKIVGHKVTITKGALYLKLHEW